MGKSNSKQYPVDESHRHTNGNVAREEDVQMIRSGPYKQTFNKGREYRNGSKYYTNPVRRTRQQQHEYERKATSLDRFSSNENGYVIIETSDVKIAEENAKNIAQGHPPPPSNKSASVPRIKDPLRRSSKWRSSLTRKSKSDRRGTEKMKAKMDREVLNFKQQQQNQPRVVVDLTPSLQQQYKHEAREKEKSTTQTWEPNGRVPKQPDDRRTTDGPRHLKKGGDNRKKHHSSKESLVSVTSSVRMHEVAREYPKQRNHGDRQSLRSTTSVPALNVQSDYRVPKDEDRRSLHESREMLDGSTRKMHVVKHQIPNSKQQDELTGYDKQNGGTVRSGDNSSPAKQLDQSGEKSKTNAGERRRHRKSKGSTSSTYIVSPSGEKSVSLAITVEKSPAKDYSSASQYPVRDYSSVRHFPAKGSSSVSQYSANLSSSVRLSSSVKKRPPLTGMTTEVNRPRNEGNSSVEQTRTSSQHVSEQKYKPADSPSKGADSTALSSPSKARISQAMPLDLPQSMDTNTENSGDTIKPTETAKPDNITEIPVSSSTTNDTSHDMPINNIKRKSLTLTLPDIGDITMRKSGVVRTAEKRSPSDGRKTILEAELRSLDVGTPTSPADYPPFPATAPTTSNMEFGDGRNVSPKSVLMNERKFVSGYDIVDGNRFVSSSSNVSNGYGSDTRKPRAATFDSPTSSRKNASADHPVRQNITTVPVHLERPRSASYASEHTIKKQIYYTKMNSESSGEDAIVVFPNGKVRKRNQNKRVSFNDCLEDIDEEMRKNLLRSVSTPILEESDYETNERQYHETKQSKQKNRVSFTDWSAQNNYDNYDNLEDRTAVTENDSHVIESGVVQKNIEIFRRVSQSGRHGK